MVVLRLLSEQSHTNMFVGKVLSTSLVPWFYHRDLWWGMSYGPQRSCLVWQQVQPFCGWNHVESYVCLLPMAHHFYFLMDSAYRKMPWNVPPRGTETLH
jgi:hypothetical protein